MRSEWTPRGVHHIKHLPEIIERREEIREAEGTLNDPEKLIGAHNRAAAQLWRECTPEEHAELILEAEEWTENGPDMELLALYAFPST